MSSKKLIFSTENNVVTGEQESLLFSCDHIVAGSVRIL